MRIMSVILSLAAIACQGSAPSEAPQTTVVTTAEAPPADDGAIEGITLKVQDYQVFHPFSRTRALLEHGSPATGKKQRAKKGQAKAKDSFGAGLVVDATNTSPHLLSAPDLLGEFVMKGAHGEVSCELDPKRTRRGQGTNHLSHDPTSNNPWRDESKQTYEKVWRPGETIRLRIREDCGNFFVYDTDLQEISTSFKVEAHARLSPGNADLTFPMSSPNAPLVRSETMTLTLPPSSVVLQQVEVEGKSAYAAGDVVITWDGNRVVRSSLGNLGLRADTLKREELPAQLQDAVGAFDELGFQATAVSLTHWTDGENISKGQRLLEVEATLGLDTAGMEKRLTKSVNAEAPNAQAAIAKGMATETARLLKLLPCARIALVTTKREIGPFNAGEATGACAGLSADTPAQLRLRYRLGRYEVPIGIVLRTRGAQRFVPLANQTLLGFDPR